MANTLQTADLLLEKILFHFRLMNTFLAPNVGNHEYEEYYLYKNNGGYFPGNSVRVRLPNLFEAQRGFALTTPNPLVERYATISLQDPISIWLEFTSDEATTKISMEGESWAERAMMDKAHTMMTTFNGIVSQAALKNVYHYVGDASSDLTTLDAFYYAKAMLEQVGGIGSYNCYSALHPRAYSTLAPSLLAKFLPNKNEEIYKAGSLGNINDIDVFKETQIVVHRAYSGAMGTPLVRVNMASGDTTVKLKGLTASITGIIKAGDLFTITGAGVNPTPTKLNYITKEDTGIPFQFVATADADSDVSGNADVSVEPVLISDTANPQRNISGIFHVDDTVTFVGSYVSNIVWYQPSLNIVAPPLKLLNRGAQSSLKTDPDTKIAIRYSQQDSVQNSTHGDRVDIWPGVLFRGEMACKIITKIPG